MSDLLVLAMDGSTRVSSTALLRVGGQAAARWDVVARRTDVDERGQARVLLRLVDEMLEEVGAEPSDLGTIVVGVGPGTFTGVRIAVATARGLALGLAVPVLGVSTLSALAAGAIAASSAEERGGWSCLVPVIDARRSQLFLGVYEASELGGRHEGPRWTRKQPFSVCAQGDVSSVVRGGGCGVAVVIGDQSALAGDLPADMRFVEHSVQAEFLVAGQDWLHETVGGTVVEAAGQEMSESLAPGVPELVKPIYVRAPDADLHITKMKDPWARGRA